MSTLTTRKNGWKKLERKCGEEVCGRPRGKNKPRVESWWWWNDDTVKEKKDRLNMWEQQTSENDRAGYKRATTTATSKKVVARVRAEAAETEMSDGEKDIDLENLGC